MSLLRPTSFCTLIKLRFDVSRNFFVKTTVMYRHLRNYTVKIIVKKEFVFILSHFLWFLPVYSLEKNHFKMKNENTQNNDIKSLFDEFLTGLTGNCDKIMIDLMGSYCANKLWLVLGFKKIRFFDQMDVVLLFSFLHVDTSMLHQTLMYY